jgi:excisionase family DNA binding protein
MEPYMTVREVAEVLRLSEQTIQRYVLKKEIPYVKIRKVIRFRPADIEKWVENGGIPAGTKKDRNPEGDLFTGIDGAGCPPAVESDSGKRETGEVRA